MHSVKGSVWSLRAGSHAVTHIVLRLGHSMQSVTHVRQRVVTEIGLQGHLMTCTGIRKGMMVQGIARLTQGEACPSECLFPVASCISHGQNCFPA